MNCIIMHEDGEGFLYPTINNSLCIHCGLCENVCPFQHPLDERVPLSSFAAFADNEIIRKNSSSGGIFSSIARYVFDKGGVVFGAMFDENWNVIHGSAENDIELERLIGSKYVQSNLEDCFHKVTDYLQQNRFVLFSGTPCQIAGLNHYLGKEYDRLLTIDVVCHGVPSPRVWRWYLDKVKKISRFTISKISFRNKDKGWRNYSIVFDYFQSGINVVDSSTHRDDPYMKAFLSNKTLRPSCYFCQAKSVRSHSDITLADFWNVEKVLDINDDDKGVSLVLVNTLKGDSILHSLDKCTLKSICFEQAIHYNRAWAFSYSMPVERKRFFSSYKRHVKDFDKFIEQEPNNLLFKALKKKIKRCINMLRK